MVLLEAKRAVGDGPGAARECLVVQPRIRNGPVEVFLCQSLTPEAAVVGHPAAIVKVSLCPHDGSLVCKQFGGLVREAGGQEGCHYGETLDPNRYVLDRRAGGKGRLARCVRQGIVDGYLGNLDILEIEDPLSHLGWQHRRGVVRALRGEGRGGEDQATGGSQGRVTSGGEGVDHVAEASKSRPAWWVSATEAGVKIGVVLGRESPAADSVPGRGQQERKRGGGGGGGGSKSGGGTPC